MFNIFEVHDHVPEMTNLYSKFAALKVGISLLPLIKHTQGIG